VSIRRKPERFTPPPQITLGGKVGKKVWRLFVLPLIRNRKLSTRQVGKDLGVSHMTVARWRKGY